VVSVVPLAGVVVGDVFGRALVAAGVAAGVVGDEAVSAPRRVVGAGVGVCAGWVGIARRGRVAPDWAEADETTANREIIVNIKAVSRCVIDFNIG